MVVCDRVPDTQEAEAGVSLELMNSRSIWATLQNPISKQNKTKQKQAKAGCGGTHHSGGKRIMSLRPA
jgi:hypothetical protein